MVPAGLVGLSSSVKDEIVLFEVPGSEWGNSSNVTAAKDTLFRLGRNDFVYVEFYGLEVSDTKGTRSKLSKCPVCEVGSAACIQELTIAEYKNNGGSILFLDELTN